MDKPHKKLEAWKMAMDLVLQVYRGTAHFPVDEKYGLTSQTRRAAVSIPCNIAEGAARQSRKELLNFLSVAQGSASELDTLLELARQLGYLTAEEADVLDASLDRVGRLLSGLIQYHRKMTRNSKA